MPIDDTLKIQQLSGNPVPEVNPGLNYVRPIRNPVSQATNFRTLAESLGVLTKTAAREINEVHDFVKEQGANDFYEGKTPQEVESGQAWGLGSIALQGYQTVEAQENAAADYSQFDNMKTELADQLSQPTEPGALTVPEQAEEVYAEFIADSAERRGLKGAELAYYQRAMGGRNRDAMRKLGDAFSVATQSNWDIESQDKYQNILLTQSTVDHNGNPTTPAKAFVRAGLMAGDLADVQGVPDYGKVKTSHNMKTGMIGALTKLETEGNPKDFNAVQKSIRKILNDKELTNKDAAEVRRTMHRLDEELDRKKAAQSRTRTTSQAAIRAAWEQEVRQFRLTSTVPKRFENEAEFESKAFVVLGKSIYADEYALPTRGAVPKEMQQLVLSATYGRPINLPGTDLDGRVLESPEDILDLQGVVGEFNPKQITDLMKAFESREESWVKQAKTSVKGAQEYIEKFVDARVPKGNRSPLGASTGWYKLIGNEASTELLENTSEWIELHPEATPDDVDKFVKSETDRIMQVVESQFENKTPTFGTVKVKRDFEASVYRDKLDELVVSKDGLSSYWVPGQVLAANEALDKLANSEDPDRDFLIGVAKGLVPVESVTSEQESQIVALMQEGNRAEAKRLVDQFIVENTRLRNMYRLSTSGSGDPFAENIINASDDELMRLIEGDTQ